MSSFGCLTYPSYRPLCRFFPLGRIIAAERAMQRRHHCSLNLHLVKTSASVNCDFQAFAIAMVSRCDI